MKNFTQLAVVVALTLSVLTTPRPLAAQGGVAIAGFETDGSVGLPRPDYDAMGRAVTVLLGTALRTHSGAKVVEIHPTGGIRMGRIDVTKARAAATQAGAKYLIVGTILDQYGDLRVEARLLNALTGDPLAVIRADKGHTKREELGESIADLAIGLGGRAELGGLRPAPERKELPVDAVVSFGRGLQAEEAGNRSKAADDYREALKLAPGLSEAAAALRRVGG